MCVRVCVFYCRHDQVSVTDMNVHQSGFKTIPSFMVTRPTTDSLLRLVQASATSGLQNNMFRDDDLSARSGHCFKDRRTESVPASVSTALETVGGNRSQTHVVCAEPQRNFQDKNESCMPFHPKGQTPRVCSRRVCSRRKRSMQEVSLNCNTCQKLQVTYSIPEASTGPQHGNTFANLVQKHSQARRAKHE